MNSDQSFRKLHPPATVFRLMFLATALIIIFSLGESRIVGAAERNKKMNIIEMSRDSCVEISSQTKHSKGTGFMLTSRHVVTAFHVIASVSKDQNVINWTIHPDIRVKLPDGETLSATCVTVPTQSDPAPLKYDFAILRLEKDPLKQHRNAEIASIDGESSVGDDIIFSGFPLGTPGMVTHKGMISGFDAQGNIIILQAPINKGNSGGAVLTQRGNAIGIISMREGGISKGLKELSVQIDQTIQQGSVKLMGIDPLQSTKAIIETLDQYISTGIGYAISIKFLRNYLAAHSDLTK